LDGDLTLEVVDLGSRREVREVSGFLEGFGLGYGTDLDYSVVLRRGGAIVATGSFKGEVLRNMAVSEGERGQGVTATVVTALMGEQTRRGMVHFFVFTTPKSAPMFASLGFGEIARAEPGVALLETGLGSIDGWCRETAGAIRDLPPRRAALVMNCNPFTKGHEALVRRASEENPAVVVLIVSEDRSDIPFADRFRLAREGLKALPNVRAVPSGKYSISDATFPDYFLKSEDGLMAQARLDATIFADRIAPALDISARYLGEEPNCPVTRAYNETLLDVLPRRGVRVEVMPRLGIAGQAISASLVREAWRAGDWATVSDLAPRPTLDYLRAHKAGDPKP
jgi:[citrate (pro-3S)-lyase] ligase